MRGGAMKSILIAEDEDAVRLGICKYIQLHTDRFDKILMAENGQQALELIRTERPGIMLLDIRMPVKNGIEVMQKASEQKILPETIIFSGFDDFTYAQQAIRYGAREYFLKPTRSSDILELIHKLADEVYGKEESEAQPEEQKEQGVPQQVLRAEWFVREHYNEDISAAQTADFAGITAGYLSTLFSRYRGYGFSDYLNQIRINQACGYLEQGNLKTYEIAYKVGYKDEKYFSKIFKKIKGISPAEYRKTGA